MDRWIDISGGSIDKADFGEDVDLTPGDAGMGNLFWFDREEGTMHLRYRYLQPKKDSVCISYRYGSDAPIPAGIKRLCNLIVATDVLTMDFYSVKVGMGGDISGLRDQALSRWDKEIGRLYSTYQRPGVPRSLLQG